jgi:phosphoribosyl-ATP pyrophosphohydrolase/phosphoribosyl-AMP cyclohydrolase
MMDKNKLTSIPSCESTPSLDVEKIKERLACLDWEKVAGLVPTVVQDHHTGRVLMLAMMSKESLEKTLHTGLVTFFSRSRQNLWTKGETSGHYLRLINIQPDCDGDSLLVYVVPHGPTCHTGAESCFDSGLVGVGFAGSGIDILNKLWATIELRAKDSIMDGEFFDSPDKKASYTARLLREGVVRCAQKVGEEGVEVALAAVSADPQAFVGESADLIYHLFVLLKARGVGPESVWRELGRRHNMKK